MTVWKEPASNAYRHTCRYMYMHTYIVVPTRPHVPALSAERYGLTCILSTNLMHFTNFTNLARRTWNLTSVLESIKVFILLISTCRTSACRMRYHRNMAGTWSCFIKRHLLIFATHTLLYAHVKLSSFIVKLSYLQRKSKCSINEAVLI